MPSARVIENAATFYGEPSANSALMQLPVGAEMQLGAVKNAEGRKWVAVSLSDGRKGFVAGDTKVFTAKSATLLQDEVVVYSTPSASSGQVVRLSKKARFDMLDQVPGEGGNWVKVRDSAGREGFIAGGTQIVKGEGLPRKEAGLKNMKVGGLWCLGGAVVTAVTYSMATDGGGTYLVMWGPVLFGGYQFLKGLVQYVGD